MSKRFDRRLTIQHTEHMKKKIRAILIDAKNKTVTEVEIAGELADYYRLIGCEMVEIAFRLPKLDVCFVDEEALLNDNPKNFFEYNGAGHQPYAGNGLIVGGTPAGNAASAKISLAEVKANVVFLGQLTLANDSI